MIRIIVDKESEYQWIRTVIDHGVLNCGGVSKLFE